MSNEEELKSAFARIIKGNMQRILRICWAYSHNKEDQKDLFQEVALNIWKSLPSFRKEAAMDTYVYRICLNVCMQQALHQNKSKNSGIEIEGLRISDQSADLQNNLENKQKLERIYQCISKLNDAEKSLILLFLEDLPYKTISEVTGISENYVAVKLNRIKKKLFNSINS